jgi:hypothetical protein
MPAEASHGAEPGFARSGHHRPVRDFSGTATAVEEMPQLNYLRGPDLSGPYRRICRASEHRNH